MPETIARRWNSARGNKRCKTKKSKIFSARNEHHR
jgi:hypothetical protein